MCHGDFFIKTDTSDAKSALERGMGSEVRRKRVTALNAADQVNLDKEISRLREEIKHKACIAV